MPIKPAAARARQLLIAMQRASAGLRLAANPTTPINASPTTINRQLSVTSWTAGATGGEHAAMWAPTKHVLRDLSQLSTIARQLSSSSSAFTNRVAVPLFLKNANAARAVTTRATLASLSPLEKLREKVKRDPSILDIPLPYVGELPAQNRVADGGEPAERDEGFRVLGLREDLLKAVEEGLRLEQPTEIQEKAIPAILEGKDVLLGSHTGSGKTLAYLLPIIQVRGSALCWTPLGSRSAFDGWWLLPPLA